MNTLRFGIYAGAAWALVSLILIILSIAGGADASWVELDFRPLTWGTLLIADGLGFSSSFRQVALYAEYGLPIEPVLLAVSLLLAFADGFVSGFLIALLYNLISIIREGSKPLPALYFGIAAGIVLGICSGMLALVGIMYGFLITSFDFTVRPVWALFTLIPEPGSETYTALKDSYIYFPKQYAGALWWALWGFADGFIAGTVLAFIYTRTRALFQGEDTPSPITRI